MLSKLMMPRINRTCMSSSRRFVTGDALSELNNSLIITNACAKKINALRDSAKNHNLRLRISVDSGGCSGFQYEFKMEDVEPNPDDKIISKNGAEVLVDEFSMDFLKGSTIDYVQELIRSSFAVTDNPQSETACGCGSSFALKQFNENSAAH